ncbi:MAG: hypothetical protein Q9226_001106 [Calogaya cf. arnoldii]
MVTPTSTGYKITGIIDWDDALALPRTLTRRTPDWIWDFEKEGFTGYMDTDAHPKADSELSPDNLALKNHFDAMAEVVLGEQYLDDAYGTGRLLRRMWTFVKEGCFSTWFHYLALDLVNEWEDRLGEPEVVSEEVRQAMSEDLPEPASEDLPEVVSEDLPEPVSEEVPEATSEVSPEPVAEVSPEPVSEVSPEPVLEVSPVPEQQPAEPELALDKPPMSQQLTAVPVAVPLPQQPVGLWAKIGHWFRICIEGVRARL